MVFLVLFATLCCQAFNVILSRDFTHWFLNHPPPINLLTYIVHYLTFARFFALNLPIHSNANFDSLMHKDTENYCLVNGKLSVSCIGFSFLAFPLHSAVKHSGGKYSFLLLPRTVDVLLFWDTFSVFQRTVR
jgi:hypothetical protein